MPFSKTAKPLAIYLVIIIALAIGLNFFLKSYSKANFTGAAKEALINSPSRFLSLSEDPCSNSILGDPGNVLDNYVKVNIHCTKNISSTNTLEFRTLAPDTYLGAIYLVGKINSFSVGIVREKVYKLGNLISDNNEWRCFSGIDSQIKNFDDKIKKLANINCFYKFSDQEIKNYYETH